MLLTSQGRACVEDKATEDHGVMHMGTWKIKEETGQDSKPTTHTFHMLKTCLICEKMIIQHLQEA